MDQQTIKNYKIMNASALNKQYDRVHLKQYALCFSHELLMSFWIYVSDVSHMRFITHLEDLWRARVITRLILKALNAFKKTCSLSGSLGKQEITVQV